MSHPHSNIQAAARSLCARIPYRVRSLFLSDVPATVLLLAVAGIFLVGKGETQ